MATEDQVLELENRYVALEARRDYCCRDMVIWKTYTRVVSSTGMVVSNFNENVNTGIARRGYPYTVTFTPKWDASMYYDNRSGWRVGWGGGFEIRTVSLTTTSGVGYQADQAQRELVDLLLSTAASPKASEAVSGNSSMNDITNLQGNTKYITTQRSSSQEPATLPQEGTYNNTSETGNFYIYRESDGTIAVDVLDRRIYRGMEGYYPNDPAYLTVFCTQFVMLP